MSACYAYSQTGTPVTGYFPGRGAALRSVPALTDTLGQSMSHQQLGR